MSISRQAALESIYRKKFNSDFDWSEPKLTTFRQELIEFCTTSSGPKISEVMLRKWLPAAEVGKASDAKLRQEGVAFLDHFIQTNLITTEDERVQYLTAPSAESRLKGFIDRNPVDTSDSSHVSHAHGLDRSNLIKMLFRHSTFSAEELDIFLSAIYPTHGNARLADIAYFLAFRYSTTENRIMASFLAILTPEQNALGFYSYAHFVEAQDDHGNTMSTETRGVVLNLPKATYFLGSTERDAPKTIANFELLATDRDTLALKGQVLPALGMSSAAVWQPVIARYALLRLGTRSSLGVALSSREIKPQHIKTGELGQYIANVLTKMGSMKCNFDKKLTNKKFIADQIISKINNCPLAYRDKWIKDSKTMSSKLKPAIKTGEISIDGAIEIFGPRP